MKASHIPHYALQHFEMKLKLFRNKACWVDLGWPPGRLRATLSLPLLSRIGKNKIKKLLDQCKGSLITEKQRPHMEANEKDLFCTSNQQVTSRHFLGSSAPVHIAVALEEKCCNTECGPFLLSLSFYC